VTDLVTSLRNRRGLAEGPICMKAADLIETLEAENARLRELEWLVEQGLAIDGEFIPLLVEGGLVDRSAGIDEPPYLTVPDAYDTPDVRQALFYARRSELGNQPRVRMCEPKEKS
jgi:hypothetical protein